MAREYLWLYLGGGAIALLGFAYGTLGVLAEAADDWSRGYRGWFPFEPWPAGSHWLSFLVVGIVLTLSGMGITRHRRDAWLTALALGMYQMVWTVARATWATGSPVGREKALFFLALAAEAFLLLLGTRIGLALHRTPPRRIREPERAMDQSNGSKP
jgi:hypothetical protein